MKTTIGNLIQYGILVKVGGLALSNGDYCTEYRVEHGKIIAFQSQPYAVDVIEQVNVIYNSEVDYDDCELVPMAGDDHSKYVRINSEIEIKIFHEEC